MLRQLVVGVPVDVAVEPVASGVLPSVAVYGREARYTSSSSDMAIPMNRPGSVSKTVTPSSAATAAMKSGRAASPNSRPSRFVYAR